MMNGEGPSVPITTLACIQSLTDLLLELPLPTPLPGSTGNRSLLNHLRETEDVKQILNGHESYLAPQLIEALSNTNTDHVEVKDGYAGASHGGPVSHLLQYIISQNPNVFNGMVMADHHQPTPWVQRQLGTIHQTSSYPSSSSAHHPNSPQLAAQGSPCFVGTLESKPQKSPLPMYSPAYINHPNVHTSSHQPLNPIELSPSTTITLDRSQSFYQETPSINKFPAASSSLHSFSNGSSVEKIASPLSSVDRTDTNHLDLNKSITPLEVMPQQQSVIMPVSKNKSPVNSQNNNNTNNNNEITNTNQKENKSTSSHVIENSSLPKNNIINNNDISKKQNLPPKAPIQPVNKVALSESKTEIVEQSNEIKNKDLSKKDSTVPSSTNLRDKKGNPIVLLDKLSIEDQVLAQKSVKQFTAKSKHEDVKKSPTKPKCDKIKRKLSDSEDPVSLKRKERDSLSKDEKPSKRPKICNKLGKKSGEKSSISLTERVKKRRRITQASYAESPENTKGEEHNDSDDSYKGQESEPDNEKISNPSVIQSFQSAKEAKLKKIKKELQKDLAAEDLMDTNTYMKFSRMVEAIFDSMEDVDLTQVIQDEGECPAEALIPLSQLLELCNEAAKLKMLKATNKFPPERLLKLIGILERNVMDGAKILPIQSIDEKDEDEAKLWLELTIERVMRSADASLTALYIMTSPKMPSKVFLEDIIEKIIIFIKFQIQNTIFPTFDPAYRVDPKSKDGYIGNIKQKRAHANKVKSKSILLLYNKLHEAVGLVAELLELQTFTDTIILQISTLGVSPFFVEGISELQLNALHLVTTVFARYEKHRQLILEDILASIARLPTSKRSLRNYRLNSEEHIQMLTALVLQLIHSVVKLPDHEVKQETLEDSPEKAPKDSASHVDKDVLIITSYEASLRTAINFLSVFLKKCGTKHDEMDYRPLFEYFVQDLLSTVNKPEWPASELLLSLLGRMLVKNFSDKSLDMTLRVASLDYLGVVAAKLRRDAVTSQQRKEVINEVIKQVLEENSENDLIVHHKKKKSKKSKPSKKDDIQILQKALLQYLDSNVERYPSLQFSRKFYIAQWYRDAALECSDKKPSKEEEKKSKDKNKDEDAQTSKSNKGTKSPRSKTRRGSQVTYREEEEEKEKEKEDDDDEERRAKEEKEEENNAKLLALAENRKRFLLSALKPEAQSQLNNSNIDKHIIDFKQAELISSFLASRRPFSQSFDIYLSQILRVLNETAVAVRTKAMKCLTLVVEADPSILAREDMQRGVHGRLLDQSISVREAAVDLVGKFILIRPELTSQYYDMLTERILDTGVSVRKRVIKILKDVCLEQPDFNKIPEICVKMIRRVNDEEGIKKLVGDVFQNMWFSPISDKDQTHILRKVKTITHVVSACKDFGLEWFEQLLNNLLKSKDDPNYRTIVKSCKQIVDCLVENMLQLEESNDSGVSASQNLVACLMTIYLFCKTHPFLVVPHATTIQPYLSMQCNTQADYQVLLSVAKSLELIVPLIEHPSETFLAQIEEDMVKLIIRQGMAILPSCVSCLGTVVNKVSKNYELVRECFQKFLSVLFAFKNEHEKNPVNPVLNQKRPMLLRSLFTVGLFCRHFDFNLPQLYKASDSLQLLKDQVFEGLFYFIKHEDDDIMHKALTGLGYMMIRHYEFMLQQKVKDHYYYLLIDDSAPATLKCQVLRNLSTYLLEEEAQMIQKDAEWSKMSKNEDLKEMGDVSSGMASTVIQVYLKQILETILSPHLAVRKNALLVVSLILNQGLVHPVQIVPYLICVGSDDDKVLRTKADNMLQDIEKKYPGFVQMKALPGVRMSYKMLHSINVKDIAENGEKSDGDKLVRGFRINNNHVSKNGFLYHVIRGTRQNRRAFLRSLLKLYDDSARTPLKELLYIADNIVYLPYQVQDEPLYVIHHIDIMLSVIGYNLLQSFREGLLPPPMIDGEDEDDDNFESIDERLPVDTKVLQECMTASQGCLLLLFIKQTLKEMYGFTDNKLQQYTPNESAKVNERPLNRKSGALFKPDSVLSFIRSENNSGVLDEKGKKKLINQYLNFKQLMLTIDPDDDDEDDDDDKTKNLQNVHLKVITKEVTSTESKDGNEATATPVVPPLIICQQTPEKNKSASKPRTPNRSQHKAKLPKPNPSKKKEKKSKKRRRRILDSDDSGDHSGSDPDFDGT